MQLQNRWVVITGGSSGIGRALAAQLVQAKNRVTIVANDPEQLVAAADQLNSIGGGRCDTMVCDIGQSADIDVLANRLLAGRCPDVLINNAGFATYRPFEIEGIDEIERLLAVNLTGHVRLTKHVLGAMIMRRVGAISFMTSIAGRLPITPNATYCAAKHGMIGLAEALRYEVRRFGIEVTAICPGRVNTPFFDHPTFQARTRGPETHSSITADRAAQVTIDAIQRNQFLTYVPRRLGLASWLYHVFPTFTHPAYSLLMGARIERLYADLE